MRPDQRSDQARHEQHMEGVEARDRGGPELGAGAQEVGQVGTDYGPEELRFTATTVAQNERWSTGTGSR